MATQLRSWPPQDVVGSETLTRQVQGHRKDRLGEAGPAVRRPDGRGAGVQWWGLEASVDVCWRNQE